ncbi:MAG: phosphate acyltransferase PlsX [Clostridia bacterium]|nr:phosphate acyltransferase PlsX [Clostridia bacterium]
MKIILDAMSGDLGPLPVVEAAAKVIAEKHIEVMLVGKPDAIEKAIAEAGVARDGISIKEASDVITMEDDPTSSIRSKKDSSMVVALKALSEGEGDALVSAGNTGALLTGATLIVKRLPGVRRGAIGTVIPTGEGRSLLIDSGANAECTPEYLVQFAHMGTAYMAGTQGIEKPRVGLLNNGTEEHKGAPLQKETHQLLKAEAGIHFIGNVEGRDLAAGAADVFVCDGFTGNLVLKTYEGVGMYFSKVLKTMFKRNVLTMLAALMFKKDIKDLKSRMDYREVGGAPILGINKPVIKAHGSSDARAFETAMGQAIRFHESGAVAKMAAALAPDKK